MPTQTELPEQTLAEQKAARVIHTRCHKTHEPPRRWLSPSVICFAWMFAALALVVLLRSLAVWLDRMVSLDSLPLF